MLIKNTFTPRILFIALATAFSVAVPQPFKTTVNAQSANLSAPYVGVWEGNGSQAGSSWTISITLTPGAVNSVVGTIAYPSLSCGGNLTLRRIKAQSIELAEEFTYGAKQCVRGIVVLQTSSDKKLEYKWLFPDRQQGATGSVRKIGNGDIPCGDEEIQTNYDPNDKGVLHGYHHYEISTTICSTSSPDCTVDKIFKFMKSDSKYIAPVKDNKPVSDCMTSTVHIPYSGDGTIRSVVSENLHSFTNYTRKDHPLRPGKVVRTVLEKNNSVIIKTIGEGNGYLPSVNESSAPKLWGDIDNKFK
jgi:hypothetical protein